MLGVYGYLPCSTSLSKAIDWVWHAGLLHKVKSYGILGQVTGPFLSDKQLSVVLYGKSLQEYPVNVGVH